MLFIKCVTFHTFIKPMVLEEIHRFFHFSFVSRCDLYREHVKYGGSYFDTLRYLW